MRRTSLLGRVGAAGVADLFLLPPAYGGQAGKLPPAEMSAVFKAAGFTERGAKVLDACGQPADSQVGVVDLNGDGPPEVSLR